MNIVLPIKFENQIYYCNSDFNCTSNNCTYKNNIEFFKDFWLFKLVPELLIPLVHKIKFENLVKITSKLNSEIVKNFSFKNKKKEKGRINKIINNNKQRLIFEDNKLIQYNNFILSKTINNIKVMLYNDK